MTDPDGRLSAREFLRGWSANARTTKSIGELARAVLVSGRSTLIDGTEGLPVEANTSSHWPSTLKSGFSVSTTVRHDWSAAE